MLLANNLQTAHIEGHTLKTNCIWFFILFYWRKKFCFHFEKYIFFLRVFFHFFTLFSLRFISTQSDFGANKRAFKHCTPLIMVSLASSPAPGPILIPKWGQKTTNERQNLHIPKYHHFRPSFLAMYFLAVLTCKLGIAGFVWSWRTYSNIKRRSQDNISMCEYDNSHSIRHFSQFWL